MTHSKNVAIERHPLCWPHGWRRTPAPQRQPARYKVDALTAWLDLNAELARMGARQTIISTNVPLRRDGRPLADAVRRQYDDPGCAVYFRRRGQSQCIACDFWTEVRANVRAIFWTIYSLRQLERSGASDLMERAFVGFRALPPATDDSMPCYVTLGVDSTATEEEIKSAYRAKARQHHPDSGGSDEQMSALNHAFSEAMLHVRADGRSYRED